YTTVLSYLFFFHTTPTTEIYTLSLHDALPICSGRCEKSAGGFPARASEVDPRKIYSSAVHDRFRHLVSSDRGALRGNAVAARVRSEEHTSELQSRGHLVCRLLLEKKKNNNTHK